MDSLNAPFACNKNKPLDNVAKTQEIKFACDENKLLYIVAETQEIINEVVTT